MYIAAKRIVVIGGYVYSHNDHERHYINPMQICHHFQLNPGGVIHASNPNDVERLRGLDLSKCKVYYADDTCDEHRRPPSQSIPK